MTQANFKFISDASGGDQFTVVSFSGTEAISSLYEYQIEIKAPLSTVISLDDVLDSPARFITDLDGKEYPVYGMLSNFEELQTVQDTVHFKAILVPRLWGLSIYKTNEIYTQEKTVDLILETVLENAGLYSGTDYDMNGLAKGHLLSRDYVCQFGESDFDFISRLMENEGIFYYFDQSGDAEKTIFINDMNYEEINRPALIYDVMPSTSRQFDCIDAWICRKQRLAGGVTVRDFNPDHPSMDIAGTTTIDQMSRGTDYFYGENIQDTDEAAYLSEIRAEESLCKKTRYYGEGSVTRLQAGYLFEMGMHPNENYNGIEYLAIEVNHEGLHLDMQMSSGSGQAQPQYRNSFVAIEAAEQFRPARITPKPRFYGTMTGFIYAESVTGRGVAEVDEQGRYRVHLPFDRTDGSKDSTDPNRKASTWIRMAQPYVGKEEGMCFPLEGGTEVLLTFINGDPDQPIISAALPNASTPSLLNSETAHTASIVTPGGMVTKSYGGSYANQSIPRVDSADQASASVVPQSEEDQLDAARHWARPEGDIEYNGHFMPPDDFSPPLESNYKQFPFSYINDYGMSYVYKLGGNLKLAVMGKHTEEWGLPAHIDRSTGPMYIHRVGSTFAYPQQERVYFCGTFHEDFHMDDLGVIGYKRLRDNEWRMTSGVAEKERSDPQGAEPEVFHFPEPGEDGMQPEDPTALTDDEKARFQSNRVRGVSEDKRWGDQMNYAWGRSFNWAGGPEMKVELPDDGGWVGTSFGTYNYGNGYTENLQAESGGTSDTISEYTNHKDKWDYTTTWLPHQADNPATALAVVTGICCGIITLPAGVAGLAGSAVRGIVAGVNAGTHETRTGLADAWNLDPVSTAVEKTWGHKYEYHNGLTVEIHEGNTISNNYGHAKEYVSGNVNSVVDGDTVATTYGVVSEAFFGSKYEFNLGTTDAMTFGLNNEIKLAGDTALTLGAYTEFKLAIDTAFFAGVTTDVHAAVEINLNTALKLGAIGGTDLTNEGIEAKQTATKLENALTDIKSAQATIENNTSFINQAMLALFP
ncbi:MAG: type VI secretion system tip protein VgrG [Gammaproteobacteria bacterium]|nr:type VI secretion system tip protein VgrG [Gammaproteobacteria bacterium]